MTKNISLLCLIILLASCASIEKHNLQVTKLHSVADLHDDIDNAYKQLKRHHPHLYQYTSKEVLDYKFDSLKTAINKPLDSRTFFKELAQVTKFVRQGHMSLTPPSKLYTKKERKALADSKFDINNLDFDYDEDKLWIPNARGKDSILIGSEVLEINNEKPQDLIKRYNSLIASDGYNKTLYRRFVGIRFLSFYGRDKGRFDSISFKLRNKDSVFTKQYKRLSRKDLIALKDSTKVDTTTKILPKKKLTKAEKKANKLERKKRWQERSKYGYNYLKQNYNRNLDFVGKDSAVALMKIRGFTRGKYKEFYEESFTKLDSLGTKNLIIDLRDNGGGRLNEIAYLYKFLSDKNFKMINLSEVNSRIPYLKTAMSNTRTTANKIVTSILSPVILVQNLVRTKKKDGKLYYKFKVSKEQEPDPMYFKGDIYVLINGNSFSASSILSTQLDGNDRATFVGEETGGAYNGTVAGIYKIYELPNTKVRMRIGMMHIDAPFKNTPDGYGVKPDVEIKPTYQDKLQGKDPELDWVLKDIESKK